MRQLIVYAHPNPESFNHGILEVARRVLEEAGDEVRVRDLYALNFDCLLSAGDFAAFRRGEVPEDIRIEQEQVTWAEQLIFLYPIWWYDRPAILKGWFDRVFSTNFAYRDDPESGKTLGLLEGRAKVIVTLGVTQEDLDDLHANAREWKFAAMNQGTLEYCGLDPVEFLPLFGVSAVGDAGRREMLEQVRGFLAKGPKPLAAPKPDSSGS